MTLGRIGGVLVIVACALLVITAILAVAGSSVSVLGPGPGGAAITATFVFLGAGAALLGIAGVPPLASRLLRLGLVVLATGLLVTTTSATARTESSVIYVFLAGIGISWIGVLATLAGLLGTAGPPRRAAVLITGGLLVGLAATWLNGAVGPIVAAPTVLAGAASALAGLASIGLIGIRAVATANPVASVRR